MRTAPSVSVISMAKEYGYSATDKGQVRERAVGRSLHKFVATGPHRG